MLKRFFMRRARARKGMAGGQRSLVELRPVRRDRNPAHGRLHLRVVWKRFIVGAGAQTPVGRYVLAAAAAVRCGVSAYAEHPFMIDKQGEPMVVARADWLDEAISQEDRIVTLAVGCVLSFTVKVAVTPASVVTSPEVGVIVIPATSLSMLVIATSAGFRSL
jgi:hypothetical protein